MNPIFKQEELKQINQALVVCGEMLLKMERHSLCDGFMCSGCYLKNIQIGNGHMRVCSFWIPATNLEDSDMMLFVRRVLEFQHALEVAKVRISKEVERLYGE